MTEKFVDFRIVKERVSMIDVLAHYAVALRRANQNALRGKCPLPTHSSEKSRESFSVNIDKKIWACQSTSCAASRNGKKGGNVLDFVAVMESCTVREAALKLDAWFLSNGSPEEKSRSQTATTNTSPAAIESARPEQLVAEKSGEVDVVNKPLSFTLTNIDASHPYFEMREIVPEIAKHFGAGFFSGRGTMNGRVVFPISNERGELVAYAGRAIDNSDPKYKFPVGFKKSEVLWNLDHVRALERSENPLVVVEGFFDAMKVHQAGVPRVVALMGSSLSATQEKLLAEFPRVVLFLDGDEAGREATSVIASRLMHNTFVRILELADGLQPDQLSSDEIATRLSF